MKLPLTYGLGITIAGAILLFAQYFLGLHNDPSKIQQGQIIGSVGGLIITIVGLVLGLRAIREARPDRSLSYGSAVGNGALIGVFSGLFTAILYVVYGKVINPEFHQLIYEMQVDKMAEQGLTQEQIEGSASVMRFFTGPIWIAIASFFMGVIVTTILSLIVGIFVKRPPAASAPVAA